MSINALRAHEEKKAMLERLQREIAEHEQSKEFQKQKGIVDDIDKLLVKHKITDQELYEVLAARLGVRSSARGGGRKAGGGKRRRRIVVNPHTKEEVRTAGPNNTIKEWKAEYADFNLEQWTTGFEPA